MLRKAAICAALIAGGWILASPASVSADDSAASIAAGGLVARRETRIVMAKEVLRISETKVVVDYDFRNDTDKDVTTEVAFPIPPYVNNWVEQDVKTQSFSDFRLWVDGKPKKFNVEAKAFLKGREVTGILTADHIDVASFGHFEAIPGGVGGNRMPDVDRLPRSEQRRLESLGLVGLDPGDPSANWTVHLQYHWTQTFPAHSATHIRHEYTPAVGFQIVQAKAFQDVFAGKDKRPRPLIQGRPQDDEDLVMSFCPDSAFLKRAVQSTGASNPDGGQYAYPQWVDFILTSANTWRRPIEDFTLIVERPQPDPNEAWDQTLISFCSPDNGKVEKIDANHFQVHLTNFVPTSELHIGFFGVPEPAHVKPQSKK